MLQVKAMDDPYSYVHTICAPSTLRNSVYAAVHQYPVLHANPSALNPLPQVIRTVNSLLLSDPASSRLSLAVRHYSVTPLGERTGLIQWVGGTASLFSLFRQWQGDARERHAAMVAARQQAADASSASSSAGMTAGPGAGAAASAVPPLAPMAASPRPSELFYARLAPALAEAGVAGGMMAPRREWPLPALRKVRRLYKPLTLPALCKVIRTYTSSPLPTCCIPRRLLNSNS